MPAEPKIRDTAARFSRQIVLAGVGVAGQRRLSAAQYLFTGDPSIVEPAAEYVRAAGAAHVMTVEDGSVVPGLARCEVTIERGAPVTICAAARPGGARVGVLSAEPIRPSPLADAGDQTEAGMLLAVESLRVALGEEPHAPWGIGPSR